MKSGKVPLVLGFLIGALVPLFWGILGFLLFDFPEGWFSEAFWKAVYLTCPFWRIGGYKALILMPLLNGCMYALVAMAIAKAWVLVTTRNRTCKKTD